MNEEPLERIADSAERIAQAHEEIGRLATFVRYIIIVPIVILILIFFAGIFG